MRLTRVFCFTIFVILGLVATGEAQPIPQATNAHLWGWDQPGTDAGSYTYEIAIDGQPYAPLLNVSCALPSCTATMTVGIADGRHTAQMRSVRIVNGVRQTSNPSNELTFDFFGGLPQTPQNFRPVLPPGATGVIAEGTIQQRYPFAGLDVASVWLDAGAMIYLGAQQLSTPGYIVQPGDRVGLSLWRP